MINLSKKLIAWNPIQVMIVEDEPLIGSIQESLIHFGIQCGWNF